MNKLNNLNVNYLKIPQKYPRPRVWDPWPIVWILGSDWTNNIPSGISWDEIFAKSSRYDTSQQSAQLWNS